MAGMMGHAGEAFDQNGDARQCPQRRRESVRRRTGAQRVFDPPQVLGAESRLAARAAGRFQPRSSLGVPRVMPVIRRGRRHAQLSGHRRLRFAPREPLRGLEPPRLQRSKIPPESAVGSWHESAWHRTREIH